MEEQNFEVDGDDGDGDGDGDDSNDDETKVRTMMTIMMMEMTATRMMNTLIICTTRHSTTTRSCILSVKNALSSKSKSMSITLRCR
jgi:hypothetical protein